MLVGWPRRCWPCARTGAWISTRGRPRSKPSRRCAISGVDQAGITALEARLDADADRADRSCLRQAVTDALAAELDHGRAAARTGADRVRALAAAPTTPAGQHPGWPRQLCPASRLVLAARRLTDRS